MESGSFFVISTSGNSFDTRGSNINRRTNDSSANFYCCCNHGYRSVGDCHHGAAVTTGSE